MARKRLLWQLFPSYLLVTILALFAAGWFAISSFRSFYFDQTAADLEARARLVEPQVIALMQSSALEDLQTYVRDLGQKTSTRITVVRLSGEVAADSHEDPLRMDNHASREEIQRAAREGTGRALRFSATLHESMLYFAVHVEREGLPYAVVRTAVPTRKVEEAIAEIRGRIVLGGFLAALTSVGISLWVSRRISRPLEEIRFGAERFSRGDLQSRLYVPNSKEIGGLAEALNEMAMQLDERIRTVLRQRNEQQAVLSSMVEGVLAVDRDEKILSLNQAAARLFGVGREDVQDRSLPEAIRNVDLQRFVRKALGSSEPVEAEIVLRDGGERFLQAHGASLRDGSNEKIGALVVLNDVTRLRRLENVRRDFVANVSHELRTPITSIKGFVETLLDGALGDPQEAKRFLEIMAGQADRLNHIIEDLLSLSRIEQEAERAEIALERGAIRPILDDAVQACASKAQAKGIEIHLDCGGQVAARINAQLLEQAVVNLLDNAIKYSEPRKRIEISCSHANDEICIEVKDQGCGIERQHLDRIFERFYRVDKSRSRKLGGTGLGLAIVKHISQAHHGRVSVESAGGEGSVFRIHLPATATS